MILSYKYAMHSPVGWAGSLERPCPVSAVVSNSSMSANVSKSQSISFSSAACLEAALVGLRTSVNTQEVLVSSKEGIRQFFHYRMGLDRWLWMDQMVPYRSFFSYQSYLWVMDGYLYTANRILVVLLLQPMLKPLSQIVITSLERKLT
jgi:hypothetical protein